MPNLTSEEWFEGYRSSVIEVCQVVDLACGKPAINWLPAGHASIWAWYPVISRKVTAFLGSNFSM